MMTGNEIRKAFLDFFESKGHLILPSAPLIPENDPSILWINAGMAPFKPYFDGREKPPCKRIANSQKCIRTNDIENVGRTARHHTFFEMLGNFSFGDYFKEEAISWGWEFVTDVLGMEKERLWITVYKDDDEAYNIWHKQLNIPEDRILKMGKKDNFWEIGTGPCGPCSEIHYDRGEDYGSSKEDVVGGEGDRFLEIWNLVFTQFDRTEDGEYLPLPSKNIDTGMGLERVAAILQGVESNYETDLIKPLIDILVLDTGIDYRQSQETVTAYRVIADHLRGVTMSVLDGAIPGNEGRGYVIRRILRRAVRYGRKLGYQQPFLHKALPVMVEMFSDAYPELREKEAYIEKLIKSEEERFLQTLDQGLDIINEMIERMKNEGKGSLSGKEAFTLYDTYGFPLDLTADILEEEGFTVDEEVFKIEMNKQRQRARQAREEHGFGGTEEERLYNSLKDRLGETEFYGYDNLNIQSTVLALLKDGKEVGRLKSGEKGELILDKTPFYAESGGQLGDRGVLRNADKVLRVRDTRKYSDLIIHQVEIKEGEISEGDSLQAAVFTERRKATARNHSATHLLHKALKEVLGEHVNQSGSLVGPDRLRFDFNHFSALKLEEIREIEEKVNQAVLANLSVKTAEMEFEEARKQGAVALFGEKYASVVRVVMIGDYSRELCGGTHVNSTGEIGAFKIISEGSIASGVRRIEAITGKLVLRLINEQEEIINRAAESLKTEPAQLTDKIDSLINRQKELERELASLKDKMAGSKAGELLGEAEDINGVKLLSSSLSGLDNEGLRNMADRLKEKLDSGIIILGSRTDDKALFVASVTADLVKEGYHAGKIISELARVTGGGGGGRPDMAQAGGPKADKIGEALEKAKKIISNY